LLQRTGSATLGVMNQPARLFRPKLMGRMLGLGYLLMLASGFDLFYVLAKLYVRGDAAATAASIQAHEELFLAGFAGALIGVAASLVVTALFYRLYEPVDRTLSLCAAWFGVAGCVIQGIALVFHLMPWLVLADQPYLSALSLEQRQALAFLLLRSYGQAYNIGLVFFGFHLLQLAYLTFRSTFLPGWLGALVALGAGWLVFLYPPLAQATSRWVVFASLGEVLLVLWLAVKGVDEERWHELAAASLRDYGRAA
jgi:hypothetical protein